MMSSLNQTVPSLRTTSVVRINLSGRAATVDYHLTRLTTALPTAMARVDIGDIVTQIQTKMSKIYLIVSTRMANHWMADVTARTAPLLEAASFTVQHNGLAAWMFTADGRLAELTLSKSKNW